MTLEQLLNDLISLWWKPRGNEDIDWELYIIDCARPIRFKLGDWWDSYVRSLNDLCSIDSWLRQFVCEKGLTKDWDFGFYIKRSHISWITPSHHFVSLDIGYRLMLSSIQESKEQFLLDNISLWQTQHE